MAASAVNTAQNNSVLDVRGLQPPDNILKILKHVTELPKGSTGSPLEVCLDSNPFQLYDLLQQRGYFLELKPQPDGCYRGQVKQRDIDALSH
jgi:TusA-related sulfurtransferase